MWAATEMAMMPGLASSNIPPKMGSKNGLSMAPSMEQSEHENPDHGEKLAGGRGEVCEDLGLTCSSLSRRGLGLGPGSPRVGA